MEQSQIKKPFYKKIWFWVIVALVVIGLPGAISQQIKDDKKIDVNANVQVTSNSNVKVTDQPEITQQPLITEQPTIKPTTVPENSIKVSANTIYQAYKSNTVAADEQYKDKTVKVTGVIDDFGKDIMADPYIVLKAGGEFDFGGVQCTFSQDKNSTISKYKKGQSVTITGQCNGYIITYVQLSDCEFN